MVLDLSSLYRGMYITSECLADMPASISEGETVLEAMSGAAASAGDKLLLETVECYVAYARSHCYYVGMEQACWQSLQSCLGKLV